MRMCCWRQRIYKNGPWQKRSERARRSCRRNGVQFVVALQLGAKTDTHTPSHQNFGCRSRRGERVGKARSIAGMASDEGQEQKEVYEKAQKRGKDSSCCCIDGLCAISRTRSWNSSSKNYQGPVVLRGGVVKDDSGSYAVFMEQGSSVSQIDCRKVRNRQTTWMRWTSDAYPPTPKSKWRTLQYCWNFQSLSVSTDGYVYHDTTGQI